MTFGAHSGTVVKWLVASYCRWRTVVPLLQYCRASARTPPVIMTPSPAPMPTTTAAATARA